MPKMKIFYKCWSEIKKKDWPCENEVFICKDPQKRLGENAWSVSRMGNKTLAGDITQLGLFWELNTAINLLKAERARKECQR